MKGRFLVKKDFVKKLQLGLVSLSTIALLAACADNGVDDPVLDDDPDVEEPADMDPVEDEDADDGVEDEE